MLVMHRTSSGGDDVVGLLMVMALAANQPTLPDDATPAAGIGLAPNPIVRPVVGSDTDRSSSPSKGGPSLPVPVGIPAIVAGGGVLAIGTTRRRRTDPLVVVVHGDGGSPDDFDYLTATMGIPPDRVVAFDYSSVDGGSSSTDSSHSVRTTDAAQQLDAMIRSLSEDNANIYSIHHSRGGAVGAEMIADLDEGVRPPIDGYRGAALLDPAISSGVLGAIQSLSGTDALPITWIPDDGGFDPIRGQGADRRDIRTNLGEASGIEVVTIRNTDAVLPNFWDRPEGLRVYDLPDNRPSAIWYGLVNPLFGMFRSRQAHASVLVSPDVADCLGREVAAPGTCTGLGPSKQYVSRKSTGGGTGSGG